MNNNLYVILAMVVIGVGYFIYFIYKKINKHEKDNNNNDEVTRESRSDLQNMFMDKLLVDIEKNPHNYQALIGSENVVHKFLFNIKKGILIHSNNSIGKPVEIETTPKEKEILDKFRLKRIDEANAIVLKNIWK
jgi:hypothetical protein